MKCFAKGYGCEGDYVSKPSELERAIKKGLASERPYVLQVEVDPQVPPLLGKISLKTQYSGLNEVPVSESR